MAKRVVLLVEAPEIRSEGGLVYIDYGIDNVPMFAITRHEFLRAFADSSELARSPAKADVVRFNH